MTRRATLTLLLAVGLAPLVAWLARETDAPPPPALQEEAGGEGAGGPALQGAAGQRGDRPRGEPPASGAPPAPSASAAPGAPTPAPLRLRVLGAGGQAAPGARVLVRVEGAVLLEARTDEQGRFAEDLPPGRYDLGVVADEGAGGPRAAWMKGVVLDGSGRDVEVDLGRGDAAPVRVRVLRAGAPAAGVRVHLVPGWAPDASALARVGAALDAGFTAADGTAVLAAVPPATYEVVLAWDEEGTFLRFEHEHEGEEVRAIDVPAQVALRGRVTQGWEGPGVDDARISLRGTSAGGLVDAEARSAADGSFVLRVPVGRYASLRAQRDGYLGWPDDSADETLRAERHRALAGLEALARGRDGDVRVPLRRLGGPSLVGRVVDPAGAGVAGVLVGLLPVQLLDGEEGRAARSGPDGAFACEGLRPGGYRAWVDDPRWQTADSLSAFDIPADAREPVEVTIRVVPAAVLPGRVVKPDGTPAPGARVWLTSIAPVTHVDPEEAGRGETFADAQGRFAIAGLPAHATLGICAAWGDLQSEPLTIAARREGGEDLVLRLGPAARLVILCIEPGSRRPVPFAQVALWPVGAPGGRTSSTWRAGAEGRIEIPSILRAPWRLVPSSEAHRPLEPIEVDLSDAQETRTLEILFDPGLAIAGRVQDAQGHAVPARVRVAGTSEEGERRERTTATDAQGSFRLTGFAYGRYTLTATPTHHAAVVRPDLRGGEENLEIVVATGR